MKITRIIATFLLMFPVLLVAQSDTAQLHKAVKLAEQFVIENGYTDQLPDTAKLVYEFIYDNGDEIEAAIAAKRKNSLHPNAFCWSEHEDEWHVGFLSSKVQLDKLSTTQKRSDLPGRGVVVSKTFTEIRMAHSDPLFSRFKKLDD